MEFLYIISALWLTILVGGLTMLALRFSRLGDAMRQFNRGLLSLTARPVQSWMVFWVAGGALAGLLLTWVLGRLLDLDQMETDRMMLFAAGFQIVIGYGIFLGILALIHTRLEGGLPRLFGSTAPPHRGLQFGRGLRYYMMAMPGIAFIALLYFQGLEWLGVEQAPQPIIELLTGMDSPAGILIMAVFAIVLAPIVEELVFRGMLLPLLTRRAGLVAGVVVSSLLFALLHGHLQTMFPLMVVAVFFSLGYIFGESIWIPIIMHGCFNGMNLLTLYLHKGLS